MNVQDFEPITLGTIATCRKINALTFELLMPISINFLRQLTRLLSSKVKRFELHIGIDKYVLTEKSVYDVIRYLLESYRGPQKIKLVLL